MCILRRLEIRKEGKPCRLEIFAPVPYKSSQTKEGAGHLNLSPQTENSVYLILVVHSTNILTKLRNGSLEFIV